MKYELKINDCQPFIGKYIMTNQEFRYWLSGYLNLSDDKILDHQQLEIIKKHAHLVEKMSGYLENDIINFLSQLNILSNNQDIHFLIFKKMAETILI